MGIITDDPELRDRPFVFTDRHDAGRKLGEFLVKRGGITKPLVMAIPAGGVPVGAEVARALHAPLALAVVRKVQIPSNTEAGFGAVTRDGRILINKRLLESLDLTPEEVDAAIAKTRKNVADRTARFAANAHPADPSGKTVILTDDGLASGFTMLAAVASIRSAGPARIIVAVPTASATTIERVAREADELVCLNIRTGFRFAVAEAYEQWYELTDAEVLRELSAADPATGIPG